MNNPRFTIYRLKIEPFMSGVPISEDVAEKVAEYILAHLMDIKFVDGNGEPIITYGSEIFDTLGYVTIEKKKKMTIDMKECRKQEELNLSRFCACVGCQKTSERRYSHWYSKSVKVFC